MKLARYIGKGRIEICDEPIPGCPPGGLLVRTLASGLCSGELMDWYMDRKIPHVLGHEVCGEVVESKNSEFPVGSKVFVHHHAPCLLCEKCRLGLHVHCAQWKSTRLVPGGMAEFFAVARENLSDAMRVDDLRPIDAALIEPLACIAKSLRMAKLLPFKEGEVAPFRAGPEEVPEPPHSPERSTSPHALQGEKFRPSAAVIGLGTMGLMHMLTLGDVIGYDLSESRLDWAKNIGLDARKPESAEPADTIFVCPGSEMAINQAIQMANPGGTLVLFAPTPPGKPAIDLNHAYFKDLKLVSSYSCGPDDTLVAAEWLREGLVKAEQVVSDFIEIDDLPAAYQAMKAGDILKAMVIFQ